MNLKPFKTLKKKTRNRGPLKNLEEQVGRWVMPGEMVEGIHKRETIFVLGNGPSLNLLGGRRDLCDYFPVIGINRAYQLVGCTYVIFVDPDVVETCRYGLGRLDGIIFCPERFEREPKIEPLEPWTRFKRFRTDDRANKTLSERWSSGLRWSRACCVPAVNLAYLMGAGTIAILGIDMQDHSHFYSDEGQDRPFHSVDYVKTDMEYAADWLRGKGVKCLNCSPDSILENWDRVNLEDTI